MSDIKTQIDEKLAQWGVSFAVSLVGATKRDNWECDAWRVKFNAFETDYFTGVGHRKPKPKACFAPVGVSKNSVAYVELENLVPEDPRASDVLYSLVSDAEAAEMSFSEWCDPFGYSNDSISAFDTYRACKNIGRELRKVFNLGRLEELRELLQDY